MRTLYTPLLIFFIFLFITSCGAKINVDLFVNVTKIVFETQHPVKKQVEISNPLEIKKIIKTIQLEPKKPCNCVHLSSVRFIKKDNEIKVSICGHCFDILSGWGTPDYKVQNFKMPEEFYKLFQTYMNLDNKN